LVRAVGVTFSDRNPEICIIHFFPLGNVATIRENCTILFILPLSVSIFRLDTAPTKRTGLFLCSLFNLTCIAQGTFTLLRIFVFIVFYNVLFQGKGEGTGEGTIKGKILQLALSFFSLNEAKEK
jgi:hypothetical protein